jgi:predicted ABC-type ATPase
MLKETFTQFVDDYLYPHDLFKAMNETVEDSPWHREENVWVHTMMVLNEYYKSTSNIWTKQDLIGALACAFHDVGKPEAEEEVYSEARGNYRRYGGHELISSRQWVNWALINLDVLQKIFNNFTVDDIYSVSLIIEYHLPFELKMDDYKFNNFIQTLTHQNLVGIFKRVIRADSMGRISDDHEGKIQRLEEWCSKFDDCVLNYQPATRSYDKTLHLMLGVSGSGKTTLIKKLNEQLYNNHGVIFSRDDLIVEWFGDPNIACEKERYKQAWRESELSCYNINSEVNMYYSELLKKQHDVLFIDMMNLSVKKRRYFIDQAKHKGYKIICHFFMVSLDTIITHRDNRPDKYLTTPTLVGQYNSLQNPLYGEFDVINIIHH